MVKEDKLDNEGNPDKKRNLEKRRKRIQKRNEKKPNKNIETEDNLEEEETSEKNDIKGYLEIAAFVLILIIGLIAAQHMNVVVSGSMEPTLYRGDIVIIEKTDFLGIHEFNPENVNVGDIVVYEAKWFDDGPVIHRVVHKTVINGTTYFTIKGDNNVSNPNPDPYPVEPSQITARVVKIGDSPLIIPKVGYITIWLKGIG